MADERAYKLVWTTIPVLREELRTAEAAMMKDKQAMQDGSTP